MEQFVGSLLGVVAIVTVGCLIAWNRAKQIGIRNDYALKSESTESQFVAQFLHDKIKAEALKDAGSSTEVAIRTLSRYGSILRMNEAEIQSFVYAGDMSNPYQFLSTLSVAATRRGCTFNDLQSHTKKLS